MKILEQEKIYKLFLNSDNREYRLKSKFLYRKADIGESIINISSSQIKTVQKADQIVLLKIQKKKYPQIDLLDKNTFFNNYSISETIPEPSYIINKTCWYEAFPKLLEGFQYHGKPIKFKTEENKIVTCKKGDFIVRNVDYVSFNMFRIKEKKFKRNFKEEL